MAVHVPLSSETDKIALLALTDKLTNGDPHALPSWNQSLHFCAWEGVTCNNRQMRVSALQLQNQDWGGTLASSLENLTSLRVINLTNINLHGEIPREVGHLKRLQILDLRTNNLRGKVPMEMINCSSLEVIILQYNNLTGKVPSWFGSLMQLTRLSLAYNSFVGSIPPSLGNVSSLEKLILGRNHTSNFGSNRFGSGRADDLDFLSSLENCTQLQVLGIDNNYLGGLLTEDLIANLSNSLVLLSMGSNQISGRIFEGIRKLINLQLLGMENNSLEGTIPHLIGKLKNLVQLTLGGNKLFGNIPLVVGNLNMLSKLDLSSNKFEGFIPFTLVNCTKMERFFAHDNNLSGNIPNQLFGYQRGLIELSLDSNSFTGPIPSNLCKLNHLCILHLQDNKLIGEIPMELSGCSALTELILERNSFHGNIPSFLGSLLSLEILDLSSNNFSNTIPHELVNLTLLSSLNLSFNHLSGEVPVEEYLKTSQQYHSLETIIFAYGYVKVFYGELQQATYGFSSSNLVGTGSSGFVYRGTLVHFKRPVAVKVLNLQRRGASKSFVAECRALGKIMHRNLLSILTYCSSVDYKGNDFKAIAFDFVTFHILEPPPSSSVSPSGHGVPFYHAHHAAVNRGRERQNDGQRSCPVAVEPWCTAAALICYLHHCLCDVVVSQRSCFVVAGSEDTTILKLLLFHCQA
ncbi:hypothetical protein PIB30_017379 [Stylosanthes scabra]|uniref:Protein kinase domain-containing protein n=1 Tax=Stylosanthes scabra TaxID=79078 RepID=A0ABU6V9V5_9FABA|nr:hypothetical protein [Stylosanthes scabra]